MEQPEPLHPANAEAIVQFAEETGAEVLRGDLRYPSDSGGWQLGDIDLSEHLAKYRDHEVVIVIASIEQAGEVEEGKYVCGICGYAIIGLGEYPRCKMQIERTARRPRERQKREEMFRKIDEIVDKRKDDSDAENGC